MKKNTVSKQKYKIDILILLIISIILFKPLISTKYTWGHDSFYHYSNIYAMNANFNLSLSNLFPTRISPIIAYDFGWGSGIFYPCIPEYSVLYLYKFLYRFGITNIFTSMKITHFLIFFLSGITMYTLSLKIFKNNKSALISSIFYLTYPYHSIDIYVRDALNECFMFTFIPIVFLGIEYLLEKNFKKFYLYFVLGYFFCINCHLVLSIYLTIFIVIYLILNINKILNIEIIKKLILASLLILGLSAFFIIPLIMHTINSDYVVYLKGIMSKYRIIVDTTVKLKDYFNFKMPPATTYDGRVLSTTSIPCLIAIILSIYYLKKSTIELRKKMLCFILLAILTVFFMSPLIPWKRIPNFLWNIQFVWRLNTFLLFFMCLIGGLFIKYIKRNYIKNTILTIAIISSMLYVKSFSKMFRYEDFKIESFDINKMGSAAFQYIPTKAYKNMKYVENRNKEVIIKEGKAIISNFYSQTPFLSFNIKTKGAKLELPRYYFKIYNITENEKKIQYKENNKGFIEIKVKGNSKIVLKENDIINNISIISFVTALGILILLVIKNNN